MDHQRFGIRLDQVLTPQPLAAFRLGYECVTIWMWFELYWEPGWNDRERLENSVPLTVGELHEVRRTLSDVIPTNVFLELPTVFGKLLELNAALIEAFRREDFDPRSYNSFGAPW